MTDSVKSNKSCCGFVAIIGRPNVGKSTLLNYLLKQKLSITSRKPQTTRHRILGISTEKYHQCIYVDTPGLELQQKKALNKIMNDTVVRVVGYVDVILFLVEQTNFNEGDQRVLNLLENVKAPVLLLINKVDLLKDKQTLLPYIEKLSKKYSFAEIVPVSALSKHNLERVSKLVKSYLPRNVFLFPEDQITDRSSRFLAAEIIREKITRQMGDELPYEITVEIESFKQNGAVLHVHGLVLVDKPGQKKIIVGKGGAKLKLIGSAARENMEIAFESKVMLNLWVKVKSGWADDERALQSLGYID